MIFLNLHDCMFFIFESQSLDYCTFTHLHVHTDDIFQRDTDIFSHSFGYFEMS